MRLFEFNVVNLIFEKGSFEGPYPLYIMVFLYGNLLCTKPNLLEHFYYVQREYKDAVTFYSYLPKLMLCIPFCRRGKREAQSEVVNFMQANRQVKGYLCWFVVSVQTFYSCKIKCIKLRTFVIIQNKCEQKQMSHEIHLTGLRNQGQWENLSIHNCITKETCSFSFLRFYLKNLFSVFLFFFFFCQFRKRSLRLLALSLHTDELSHATTPRHEIKTNEKLRKEENRKKISSVLNLVPSYYTVFKFKVQSKSWNWA